jgi:hypothetical protein
VGCFVLILAFVIVYVRRNRSLAAPVYRDAEQTRWEYGADDGEETHPGGRVQRPEETLVAVQTPGARLSS